MKKTLFRSAHLWFIAEPKDKKNCKIFTGIFFGISGILFTLLINPTFIELFERATQLNKGVLIGISTIITLAFTAFHYVLSEILKIWFKKQITLSSRYKLVAAILSIPLTLCLHKFVVISLSAYEGRNEGKT